MKRVINLRAPCTLMVIALLLFPHKQANADPLLKPRKYHGPIPQRSWSLSVGFLAGATQEQLFDAINRDIPNPPNGLANTEDFGPSLEIDLAYTVKPHPQFAVRGKAGVGLLFSGSEGFFVCSECDTVPGGFKPILDFKRDFDVFLFSLEGTAMYYFTDASVEAFQPYIGGGLSAFFPYQIFKEDLTNRDTGQSVPGRDVSRSSVEAGVHGVLGFLYHLKNRLALGVEARLQMAQSKFPLGVPIIADGQPETREISFDIDYTGFVLTVGVARFF